ncbi:HNH endonuclease signature motif containing protein [Anaerocolumna xylanovorans]|uniref:HNH endonuclease n=1 Tax=Anaerocolumna xylanovorans DSM 12503 TaxID=1121345 RepID=A0A1M7YBU2_9FIRM|nr:HNH endonuclease signature motif containing protein [Anaerocolumna xylanovorans]SHO50112.1 HNH endonuclease [Anaerocolumna xylanovorans DSM 12503]
MAIRYPKEVKEYIKSVIPGRRFDEVADLVNKKFKTDYSEQQMYSFAKNNKIKNGLGTGRKNPYSDVFPKEVFLYIHKNYKGVGPKEMSERLNKIFDRSYTKDQVKEFYANHSLNSGLDGRFKKGHIPINGFTSDNLPPGGFKYRFKKGQKCKNHRPVGSERVSVDGYVEIKVEEPNVWRLKQHVVWEQHNGKVPEGTKLIFLDGNKENVTIGNLEVVTNDEMLEMNRNGLRYDDPDFTRTGILIAKVNRTAAKRKRGEDN